MKVIIFSASPRKNGNTDVIAERIRQGSEQAGAVVETYRTDELDIYPCTGCGKCTHEGCVIKDDFTWIFDKLRSCDGMVFASPLYFMNVPSKGKALIDRCQSFWIAKHRLGIDLFEGRKRAGFIACSAGAGYGPGKKNIFRGITDTLTYVFDSLSMKMLDGLFITRVESGDVVHSVDFMDESYRKGVELTDFLKKYW